MTTLANLPVLPGETTPRPQSYHPALPIAASEVRAGDLILGLWPTRKADQEAGIAGGAPTHLITAVSDNGKQGQDRRIFFVVDGRNYYPNGTSPTSKTMILR